MDKKSIAVISLVVVSLLLSVLAFTRPGQVVVREIVGAASGTTHTEVEQFLSGLYTSGFKDKDDSVLTATASNSTTTLTSVQVCDNPIINIAFNTSPGIVTLPSASALINGTCLNKQGSMHLFSIRNASSTNGTNVGFSAGASSTILVQNASTTANAALATSTIGSQSILEIRAYLVTSSTQPWVLYSALSKRSQ